MFHSWKALALSFFYLSIFSAINFTTNAVPVDDQRISGRQMLNFLNYLRCMHGTTPMIWDNCLAAKAQQWANYKKTENCAMSHSGYASLGENVAAGTWRGLTGGNYWKSDVELIYRGWYNETFVYGDTTTTYKNHFTQLIWQGSTHMGCAWIPCDANEYEFWVCQFTPAGNGGDAAYVQSQVPTPCRTMAECNFALQGMDLTKKFATTADSDAALKPNRIDLSTYDYTGRTCLTPIEAYPGYGGTTPTDVICTTPTLPSTPAPVDIKIVNPATTGMNTCNLQCSGGMTWTGTSNTISCPTPQGWQIASGSCPMAPTPSPTPQPPTPSPTPAPPRCWDTTLQTGY